MSTDYIQALEAENAALRAALSDIKYGAQMMTAINVTGAFASFAKEIERVATSALTTTNTENTENV